MKFTKIICFLWTLCFLFLTACKDQGTPPSSTVRVTVIGPGTVTSAPAGISCSGTCTASFAKGSLLRISAQPQTMAKVEKWNGTQCAANEAEQCFFVVPEEETQLVITFAAISPSCTDGVRNGTEIDVDCGGSCGACGLDQICSRNADCQSNICLLGTCSNCPIDQNLIFNGDAEVGVAATAQGQVVQIPGWQNTDGFTVYPYGLPTGFPAPGDPGAAQGGSNFFAGGNSVTSSATTSIDLCRCSKVFERQPVKLTVAALLGGSATQDDNIRIIFDFKQGSNQLGQLQLGPILAANRGNITGLFPQNASTDVPQNTCSLDITMIATRTAGTSNDGYADNVSATLSLP